MGGYFFSSCQGILALFFGREPELAKGWGQIVHPLIVHTPGGPTLTDIIYYTWAGLTAREYKHLKGLKQENLRDNMTNEELVMNMLAELTTSNITKEEHPETMSEHARVAERGGSVAKVAKEAFEKQTGKKVVSPLSMKRYIESQQPELELGADEAADNDGQKE